MAKFNDYEYKTIISKYASHPKVLELNNYVHHGTTRLDHSRRVALHTYRITKLLNLDYESATKAALLHDFFFDEVADDSSRKRLINHPDVALKNAKKYFDISELEADIISKHMYPITRKMPKYLESWIVDGVDDVAAIYERFVSIKWSLKSLSNTVLFLLIALLK